MAIDDCRSLPFQSLKDHRGTLAVVEGTRQVPFPIERVFYLLGVPEGQGRGAHAHKELQQVLVAIHGQVRIEIADGAQRREITLDDPTVGFHAVPMTWVDLVWFSSDAVVLVFASAAYDEADYLRNWSVFMAEVELRKNSGKRTDETT